MLNDNQIKKLDQKQIYRAKRRKYPSKSTRGEGKCNCKWCTKDYHLEKLPLPLVHSYVNEEEKKQKGR